ncbi:hypothetical protein ACFPN2_26295 [Steroidobacter flavus]|uniref:OmpA-like domain-containing protein n=1 Tax=Steroidobacter flavus TaxID=1842136 RepID=A0ABV8SYR0_9GAMM
MEEQTSSSGNSSSDQRENRQAPRSDGAGWRVAAGIAVVALILGFLLGSCVPHAWDRDTTGGDGPVTPNVVEPEKSIVPEVPSLPTPGPSDISRIMLPFYAADVNNCSTAEFGDGALLVKESEAVLELLAGGLQWCGVGQEVVIDVQGFSSQRAFDCSTPEISDHLNIELAEARRQQVIGRIEAYLTANRDKHPTSVVRIERAGERRWPGANDQERLANMRQQLAFHDNVDKAAGKTPETFTRRVDIVVNRKGRCASAGKE